MEFYILIVVICIIAILILILFCLNDFYYCEKYKQMAKFNYYLVKCYQCYSDDEFNFILNEFYKYLDKEEKKKQKEFEKIMKKEFKKNIKNDINNIY